MQELPKSERQSIPKSVFDRQFFEDIASTTGEVIERKVWRQWQSQAKEMRIATAKIARRMQRLGIQSRIDEQEKLVIVHPYDGKTVNLPAYRPINFLPSVASKKRKPMLHDFQHYIQRIPPQTLRMAVVTFGERTPSPVSAIRSLKQGHRKVSKLNAEPWFRKFAEVVLRSSEMPISEGKFHPHIHLIYRMKGRFRKVDFTSFKRRLESYFEGWVGVGQTGKSNVLRNPQEAVKYVFKPTELLQLTDVEMMRLFEAIYPSRTTGRMVSAIRWIEPLGTFKSFRNNGRKRRKKSVKIARADGPKWEWRDKAWHFPQPRDPEAKPTAQRAVKVLGITRAFFWRDRIRAPGILIRTPFQSVSLRDPLAAEKYDATHQPIFSDHQAFFLLEKFKTQWEEASKATTN